MFEVYYEKRFDEAVAYLNGHELIASHSEVVVVHQRIIQNVLG